METPEVSNEALRISSSHEPFESVLKGWRRWRGPATEQRNCSARPTEEAVGQMMWRNESIVPCLSCLGTLAMPMTSDDVALVKCQPCIPVPRLVHWTGWLKDVKAKLYCPVYIYIERYFSKFGCPQNHSFPVFLLNVSKDDGPQFKEPPKIMIITSSK